MSPAMESIDKKQLKKLDCPKCGRAKLRYAHSTDGIAPDGGDGPDRAVRCDNCKTDFLESNASLQAQWQQVKAERTPPPVAHRH
jgi:hypothetical protein